MRCAIPFGFFLFSSGISRKVIDMLARCGLCPSYDSLNSTHMILADGQIRRARVAARDEPHMTGWDNTQISFSIHVEQRPLGPPKVSVGSTTINYPLRNATVEGVRLEPILQNRALCNIITFPSDLRVSVSHARDINRHLSLDIIDILCSTVPGFEYTVGLPALQHRSYRPPPSKYRTTEHVLRTTTIDEGTTDGTVEEVENVYLDQLGFGEHDLDNQAVPCINDQKTNALIRAAQELRRDDVSAIRQIKFLQVAIGWFHAQLNLAWAQLRTHRGQAGDSCSLQFYIALLQKSRLNSAHPDYETLVSFMMQVLRGHMLHYWEIESGLPLAEFAATKPSASKLFEIATRIATKYASPAPSNSSSNLFHNTSLLNHDLLIFYELNKSISSGDFGRVEILLTTLTAMFTGANCKNYSTELMHFIQNLKKVWTPEFAYVLFVYTFVFVQSTHSLA